jgi:hypothetical protein
MAGLQTLLFVAGSALSAAGTIGAGVSAKKAGEYEAGGLERAANEERVAGQRAAMEKRREAEYVSSAQRAKAAASGSSITGSATIMDIFGDTAQRGEYLAQVEAYGGESRARGRLDQAKASRFKGKAALTGSILEGLGTAAKAGYRFATSDPGLFGDEIDPVTGRRVRSGGFG